MVVVLRHEVEPIDHPHRSSQPGMKGRSAGVFLGELLEPLNDRCPFAAEFCKDIMHRVGVVERLECFPVGDIRAGQHFLFCLEIVEPGQVDIFKVEQVPGMFLDGPAFSHTGCARFWRKRFDDFLKPRGSAAKAFQNARKYAHGEIVRESPVCPFCLLYHKIHPK